MNENRGYINNIDDYITQNKERINKLLKHPKVFLCSLINPVIRISKNDTEFDETKYYCILEGDEKVYYEVTKVTLILDKEKIEDYSVIRKSNDLNLFEFKKEVGFEQLPKKLIKLHLKSFFGIETHRNLCSEQEEEDFVIDFDFRWIDSIELYIYMYGLEIGIQKYKEEQRRKFLGHTDKSHLRCCDNIKAKLERTIYDKFGPWNERCVTELCSFINLIELDNGANILIQTNWNTRTSKVRFIGTREEFEKRYKKTIFKFKKTNPIVIVINVVMDDFKIVKYFKKLSNSK